MPDTLPLDAASPAPAAREAAEATAKEDPRRMSHHIWTLIGGAKCRKESTIRALTGVARGNDIEVRLISGLNLPLWAHVRALNGEGQPDADAWAKTLADDRINAGAHVRLNLLVSFLLDPSLAPNFQARSYLEKMAAAGCTLESIVTLGQPTPPWVPAFGVPFADIRDVAQPTNAIAAHVRALWGWG